MSFRVATFNIRVGCDAPISKVASDLSALRLDLCALQEVGAHWSMGAPLNQVAYLAASQGHARSAYFPLLERSWCLDPYRGGPFTFQSISEGQELDERSGHFGIGLSGRGYMSEPQRLYLPRLRDEQRGVLKIQWSPPSTSTGGPAKPITVLCAHLSVYEDERALQVEALLEISESIEGPALLLADLNDTPDSQSLRSLLGAGWADLYASRVSADCEATSDRFTFSVAEPHRCIDYILGRGVSCLNAQVARHIKSSDHFPLWVEVDW